MSRRPLLAALLAMVLSAPAMAQSDDPSFRIQNNTPNVVNNVYASPAGTPNWGADQLSANEVIQPRGQRIIAVPRGQCMNDIRIVYQGGLAEERRNVNTCALTDLPLPMAAQEVPRGQQPGTPPRPQPQQGRPQAQGAPQGNPSFNLVNQSGRVIEEFYASLATDRDWGTDRLGDEVVQPNGRFAVRLPAGPCLYDLKVVFAGGGPAQERRGVNTCELNDYIVRGN